MNCAEFEAQLDDLLAEHGSGHFDRDRRRRAMRHLGGCHECLELARLAGLIEGWASQAAPEDLLAAVVQGTIGSPCRQAEEQLGDFVDGTLPAGEQELIRLHLELCPSCSGLATELAQLNEVLPRLATLDPGPGFVDRVLVATLPRSVRLRRWWSRNWPRWVRRPRFSVELAFVATLIVVLASGMPWSPAGAMPDKMAEWVRAEPVFQLQEQIRQRLSPPATELTQRLERRATALKRSELARRMAEMAHAALRPTRRATELGWNWSRAASRRLGTFFRWAASRLMNVEEQCSSPDTPPTESSEESHDERI